MSYAVSKSVLLGALLSMALSGCGADFFGDAKPEALALECNDEQTECNASIKGNELKLIVHQPSLPALKPLNFDLIIDRSDNETSPPPERAWFAGRDMFMGDHLLTIKQDETENKPSRFELSGMIPVCITGSDMVWRLNLVTEVDRRSLLLFADLRTTGEAAKH